MIALGVKGTLGAAEARAILKGGGSSLPADFDATASLLHAARADRSSWVDLAARATGLVPPEAEFVHSSR